MAKPTYDDENMVDMERTKADQKEYASEMKAESSPKYGWGMCLRFEDIDMKKLKMSKLPQPGDVFMIEARAVVESSCESQSVNNMGDRSFSLQITHLGLTQKISGK